MEFSVESARAFLESDLVAERPAKCIAMLAAAITEIDEAQIRVAELESKNEDLESDLRMARSCGCDARRHGK